MGQEQQDNNSSQQMPIRVGVLALQGSFREHMALLSQLPGVQVVEVRTREQLSSVAGLIIPGGESTTMALVAEQWGLIPELQAFAKAGRPVWGTCAGMIFLAERAEGKLHTGCVLSVCVCVEDRVVQCSEADGGRGVDVMRAKTRAFHSRAAVLCSCRAESCCCSTSSLCAFASTLWPTFRSSVTHTHSVVELALILPLSRSQLTAVPLSTHTQQHRHNLSHTISLSLSL